MFHDELRHCLEEHYFVSCEDHQNDYYHDETRIVVVVWWESVIRVGRDFGYWFASISEANLLLLPDDHHPHPLHD
jgi:hypothetical protein